MPIVLIQHMIRVKMKLAKGCLQSSKQRLALSRKFLLYPGRYRQNRHDFSPITWQEQCLQIRFGLSMDSGLNMEHLNPFLYNISLMITVPSPKLFSPLRTNLLRLYLPRPVDNLDKLG